MTPILAESVALEQIARQLLQKLAECLDAQVGFLWRRDSSAAQLTLLQAWQHSSRGPAGSTSTRSRSTRILVNRLSGLAGRCWNEHQPIWASDVQREPRLGRPSRPGLPALRAGIAFPIVMGAEVHGVAEFYSDVMFRKPTRGNLRASWPGSAARSAYSSSASVPTRRRIGRPEPRPNSLPTSATNSVRP